MNPLSLSPGSAASLAAPVPDGSRYRYAKRRFRWLFRMLDTLGSPMAWARRRLDTTPPASPGPILVIQLDHIGDAVLTTPLLRAVHQHYGSPVDVLASRTNCEIFESNPFVRRVHVSERNWLERGRGRQAYLGEVFRQARWLRRFGYGLGIDPRGDFLVALLLWLAGIPRRLGWACGGGGFLLSDVASWDPRRHELQARQALLEPLGIRNCTTVPELFPTWADRYQSRELLAALPDPESPLAVLHVAAGTPAKCWPSDCWARFIELFQRHWEGSIILVGERRDRTQGRHLARGRAGVFDFTGRLRLMQLAALLAEADLFVGADSGPAHIAAAMGTPSVVLFSGTNRAEYWEPVGPRVTTLRYPVPCSPCHQRRCPVAGHPCMSHIRPEVVVNAAGQIMWSLTRSVSDQPTGTRPDSGLGKSA